MNSYDLLNYSLAVGFLVLVGFVSYAAFNLSDTLKELTSILEKVDDIAKDAEELKYFVKKGIFYIKDMFMKKGGVKDGK